MDVEKLVLAVQKEPHLYDPKMSGYSDKLLRENTWKRIGFENQYDGKSQKHVPFVNI
jgi:hypothetical protein